MEEHNKKYCKFCGYLTKKNFRKFLLENPEVVWIQCPACVNLERIEGR